MTLVPLADVQARMESNSCEDDLTHFVWCHNEDWTLCGQYLPGDDYTDEEDNVCVVCADLEWMPCGCDCGCCAEGVAS
jgi:hypothetical protein